MHIAYFVGPTLRYATRNRLRLPGTFLSTAFLAKI